MQSLSQDLRYALRMLWKSPGFTIVAVVSLALGIGLNTAIFSIVNVILIRQVPVIHKPDRIVWLRAPISYPDFVDYREQSQSFEGMAAITGTSEFSLNRDGVPELVTGEYVTADYFNVLGVGALQGRTFDKSERQTPTPVVVLSEHLWRTRFLSDSTIVGRQISLNGLGFTVIGIAPTRFIGTEVGLNRELWVPLAMQPVLNPRDAAGLGEGSRFDARNSHWLAVFGRLKSDVSREQAASELSAIATRVAETYYGKVSDETLRSVQLLTMRGGMDPRDQEETLPLAGIAMAVVALVLLIACANIASLLVARAAVRRRETAIRQALGATRPRLVRQWLSEAIVLGLAGGALGLLLALWANQLLISYLQTTPLATLELGLDYRVLAFTLAVSIATGILFGLVPAVQSSRLNLVAALKSAELLQFVGNRRSRLRVAFVTAQVTLSVVLLVAAGLFIRALHKANAIDPGYRVERSLIVPMNLGLLRYKQPEAETFYRNLLARVQEQPGVERASLIRFAHFGFSYAQFQVFAEGHSGGETDEGTNVGFNLVGPNFFRTMEIPLLRGRDFTEADRKHATEVAVINDKLAQSLWPGEDALGKRVSLSGPTGPFFEVVGVARDTKYRTLGEPPRPYIYRPVLQSYDPKMALIVRTTGEPGSVAPAVREQIRTLDPNLPITGIKTLQEQLDLSLFPSRVVAWTLGGFGVLALLLAALGIYGIVSYSVAQRTREIGVRVALGAKQKDVLRLVLGEGLFVIGVGLGVGLLLAAALTRVIAGFLFGIGATDPLTFAAVALVLGLIALAASFIPARRATKVDPWVALRYE